MKQPAIALAVARSGILASNNLADISFYIKKFNVPHVTTGDMLVDALGKYIITEAEGNSIWSYMLAKRRKLGAPTFAFYLQKSRKQGS